VAHAAPQRAPSDARDHAAARGVAARSIWSAARDALDRAAAATAASSTAAPCPDLSTPFVTVVLSTPANHNYPAARFPEARVAASCMPPSNLMQNQDDRVCTLRHPTWWPSMRIATNIFVREDGHWKLCHHQAGSVNRQRTEARSRAKPRGLLN
jgi:hypothetical protein